LIVAIRTECGWVVGGFGGGKAPTRKEAGSAGVCLPRLRRRQVSPALLGVSPSRVSAANWFRLASGTLAKATETVALAIAEAVASLVGSTSNELMRVGTRK